MDTFNRIIGNSNNWYCGKLGPNYKLIVSDRAANDNSGSSVSISGDYAIAYSNQERKRY